MAEYTAEHPGATIYTTIGAFMGPAYPLAAPAARVLAITGLGVGLGFAINEVLKSSDPASEAVKQSGLMGLGYGVAGLVEAGLVATGIGAVPAAILAVAIGGGVVAAVENAWSQIVADAEVVLKTTGNAATAAKEVADQWTNAIASILDEVGQSAGTLITESESWVANFFSDVSNSFATGIITALPAWMQAAIAAYEGDLTLSTSPLVLDLAGKGLNLTALNGTVANGAAVAPVYLDMENTGFGIATGWIGGGSGLLAMDVNGNGKIDNQGKLFQNQVNILVAIPVQVVISYPRLTRT